MIDLLKIELEQSQRVFEENSEKIQEKLSIVYEQSKEFQRSKKELDEQLGKFGGEEDSLNRKLVIAQEKLINLERDETVERKKLAEFKEKRSEMEERLANKKRYEFAFQIFLIIYSILNVKRAKFGKQLPPKGKRNAGKTSLGLETVAKTRRRTCFFDQKLALSIRREKASAGKCQIHKSLVECLDARERGWHNQRDFRAFGNTKYRD
jgi:hypothetical protein